MNEFHTSRWGVIDMGSNGIRFSITELGTQARILPLLFQERLAISLYDVQYKIDSNHDKIPIPDDIILEIISSLRRFLVICEDFQVSDLRAVATEATREAINSQAFLEEIFNATKIQFQLLSKEEEARLGAEGIASSLNTVSGISVDLGGGSIQFNRISNDNGIVSTSGIPISLPYGAAALSRALSSSSDGETTRKNLSAEISSSFKAALFVDDASGNTLQDTQSGIRTDLYLTGGGMRGFGHIHMSECQMNHSYPFTMINGYCTTPNAILQTANNVLTEKKTKGLSKVPGVSKRRVLQLPAIILILQSLFAVLPPIRKVYFCQGGIREGILFAKLPTEIKTMDPLLVATDIYKPKDASKILRLLQDSIPHFTLVPTCPVLVRDRISAALVNMSTLFSTFPKETCAAAALQSPISGCLSNAHGLSQEERSLLAVAMCCRYGDDIHYHDINRVAQLTADDYILFDWCILEDNLLEFRVTDSETSSFTLVATFEGNAMRTASSLVTKAFKQIVSKESSSVNFHLKLENKLVKPGCMKSTQL